MAEIVRAKAILAQIKAELARVRKSNGFQTDLGASVQDEITSTGIPTAPRCTVAVTGKQRLPAGGVSVEGVIAFELPATYTAAMSVVYDAADDVERLLNEMGDRMVAGAIAGSGALVPQFSATVFLDRPDGMPVVAAEVTWTSGYHR